MLVVFDIDGTLTETTALDAEVNASAFRGVFGVPLPSTRWAEYEHATDQGIAQEAVERARLNPRRIPDFTRRFVADLRAALARQGARPVPGGAAFLDRLATEGHAIAFATGAWEASARAKLSPRASTPAVGAARELGMPFVGVDRSGSGALPPAGAGEVLADYRDLEAAFRGARARDRSIGRPTRLDGESANGFVPRP